MVYTFKTKRDVLRVVSKQRETNSLEAVLILCVKMINSRKFNFWTLQVTALSANVVEIKEKL